MGEGLVLKLVYSPVSVQETSVWNWYVKKPLHTTFTSLPAQMQNQDCVLTEQQYQSINDHIRGWESELSSWAVIWGLDYTKGTVHRWHFLVNKDNLRDIVLGLHNSYPFGDLCTQWSSTNDYFRIQSSWYCLLHEDNTELSATMQLKIHL